ncbi:MAG: hypothetical protein Q9160_007014 [Pyrenula sp. 1 TL-2023]
MTDIEDGFQRALTNFSARLSKEEERLFQFTTFEELRNALALIQDEQRKRRENMNLTRIQAFLEAMEQFSKTIELFLNVSPFVAFIWGPLKFLLQVASAWSHSFDTLLDAYQQIGENIPLFERYRELFKANPYMRNALATIYEDILEFHRKALRIFSIPTWKHLFKSTWFGFKTSFQHILDDLQRHKCLIESQASLIEYQEAQAHRTNCIHSLQMLQDRDTQNKRTAVIDWLSISDVRTDHETALMIRKEFPSTTKWIHRVPDLKAWQADSAPPKPVFWIHGKTILASSLIEAQRSRNDATVLYFYCRNEDSTKNSFLAAGRTMLAQLLEKHCELLLPIFNERMLESFESSLNSLRTCQELLDLSLQSVGRSCIFVDGLDECDLTQRRHFMSWLVGKAEAFHKQEKGRCRVLFLSQLESDIKKGLANATTLRIKSLDVKADIQAYIKERTQEIQVKFGLADDVRESLEVSSLERSQGMFLYAKLVMENLLGQVSPKKLLFEMQPHIFPQGLEQAYERVVKRVYENPNRGERIEAERLLNWIVCAKRPLRWHEIQGAVAIDLDAGEVDVESHLIYDNAKDICGSLVTILKDNSITMVHGTARQYLIHNGLTSVLKTEAQLAATCMFYLAFDCFRSDLDTPEIRSFLDRGFYSFHLYASSHWNDHLCSFINASKHCNEGEIQEVEEDIMTAIEGFTARYQHVSNVDLSSNDSDGLIDITDKKDDIEFERRLAQTNPGFSRTARDMSCQNMDISHLSEVDEVHGTTRKIRSVLEDSPSSNGSSKSDLVGLYGLNWYYCPRTACFYFHYGFPDAARRNKHCDRHERPYRCNDSSCFGATAGFTKEKQLKKHNAQYHAEASILKWEFPKWKDHDQPEPKDRKQGDHQCPDCRRTFTRHSNLKAHMRQHQGVKAFSCQKCGKQFIHDSDRKRHERSHYEEAKCMCRGKRADGTEWGCGKTFARPDALAKHFRSELGRKCFDSRKAQDDSGDFVTDKGENCSSEESERVQPEPERTRRSEDKSVSRKLEEEIVAKHLQSLQAGRYHPTSWIRRSGHAPEEESQSDLAESTFSEQQNKKRKLWPFRDEEYLHSSPSQGQSDDDNAGSTGLGIRDLSEARSRGAQM